MIFFLLSIFEIHAVAICKLTQTLLFSATCLAPYPSEIRNGHFLGKNGNGDIRPMAHQNDFSIKPLVLTQVLHVYTVNSIQ